MKKITELTAELAAPAIAEQGCTLWDVEYVKEAGTWYLRILLDKEGGVDILDCEEISRKVSDLLDELIEQSVRVVGKPVALMNKEDKVKAIQFLNNSGAFLITKSGDKVCKFFGISKYTLYSYIDEAKEAAN